MSLRDKQAVIERLASEFGYPKRGAAAVAEKLSTIHPTLFAEADGWWTSGTPIALSVHGYTVDLLRKHHGMNAIAALLTLDWLLRDPDKALPTLTRGHDRIV